MESDPKYEVFRKWMVDNGAKFDRIGFPSLFAGGLMGLCAKTEIPPAHCFLSVPNKLIVSVALAMRDEELRPFFHANPQVFSSKHPDHEFLMLASFLLRQKLIGEKSFWHPYLSVMNPSDLLSSWPESEIA
jgi:hypothetical protein